MKEEIKNYLLENQDGKYRDFSNKISKTSQKKIGVRIPLLKRYAKELLKKYSIKDILYNIDEEYYEEIMLKGIIIGQDIKLKEEEFLNYIKYYVPKINDWALCDIFVANLKLTKKYSQKTWHLIQKYLKSKKEFEIRFSLVMILNYYLDDNYIDEIYLMLINIKSDKYYVKMAEAWLLSYMFVKFYDRTLNYLQNCNIDKWIYRKTITKTLESYKISDMQKEQLRKLRNKLNENHYK